MEPSLLEKLKENSTLWIIFLTAVLLALAPLAQYAVRVVRWIIRLRAITQEIEKLPGTASHWFWGHLKEHPGVTEEGIKWSLGMTAKYPRISKFFFGAWRPVVVCNHPDTAKVILKSTEPKALSGGGGYSLLAPWLGDGLLLSSGAKWFRNRKLLTPGFHFDVLKPYMEIYNTAASTLIGKWSKESALGQKIEIYKPVCLCTLDVMLRCAFSYEADVQVKENKYVSTVNGLAKLIIDRAFKPWMYIDSLYYKSPNGYRFSKLTRYAHEVAYDLINKRRDALKDSDQKPKKYVDFLDILLLAKDEHGVGLTDEEMRHEVDTFLFEGHDTTGSAISWILYALAKHPVIQQKCRQEIQDVIDDPNDPYMDWESLHKIPYLTQCIKEGLRIYSPVPMVSRDVTTPVEIDGYKIPVGAIADVLILNLHHNAIVWGDDHDEYKPERFTQENMEKMDSYAFLPFSAGPRNCIGQNFAMHEIKVIVARVLQHFELSVDPDHKVRRMTEIVMRPEHGIKLVFKPLH